jgi:hypothetical protein
VAEDEYNLRCGATVPLKLYDSIMVKNIEKNTRENHGIKEEKMKHKNQGMAEALPSHTESSATGDTRHVPAVCINLRSNETRQIAVRRFVTRLHAFWAPRSPIRNPNLGWRRLRPPLRACLPGRGLEATFQFSSLFNLPPSGATFWNLDG